MSINRATAYLIVPLLLGFSPYCEPTDYSYKRFVERDVPAQVEYFNSLPMNLRFKLLNDLIANTGQVIPPVHRVYFDAKGCFYLFEAFTSAGPGVFSPKLQQWGRWKIDHRLTFFSVETLNGATPRLQNQNYATVQAEKAGYPEELGFLLVDIQGEERLSFPYSRSEAEFFWTEKGLASLPPCEEIQ